MRLASAALAAAPRVAAAAEPTPSEISVARRLFDEGKAAEDAGRWREAIEKFRKAIAIKDTPGLRYHIAKCEEESGALVEALRNYVLRATKLHGDDVPVPVLAPGNGKTKTGRLWTYVRDERP